ncbi:hypothetical protein [Aeromonas veronii]|uniref:hypothetical protein n=1 Tax=Aeromonas veronii TaxID=654 RepID=UPI0024451519|nr:hypothetical protein [Aeromonas veronii]
MSKMFAVLLLIFSSNVLALPDISVGTLYDYMSAEKTTLLKRVRNLGDETAFVKITLAEIIYGTDGVPKERELPEEGGSPAGDKSITVDYSSRWHPGYSFYLYGREGARALFSGALCAGQTTGG